MPESPSNSHLAQPGAHETAANGVHEGGEGCQLLPLMQRHSSLTDMRLPSDQQSCPGEEHCPHPHFGTLVATMLLSTGSMQSALLEP